jgi:hypothetical protein
MRIMGNCQNRPARLASSEELNQVLKNRSLTGGIQLLLNRGAIPNEDTLITALISNHPAATIDLLLMHGAAELMADTHQRKQKMLDRHQSLIRARTEELINSLANKASTEDIELLLKNGAKPNIVTLLFALENNYPIETIELLLKNGAKPNENTLNKALLHNHPIASIQLLLGNGATPGVNTLNLALIHNYPTAIIQLLIGNGAKPKENTLLFALHSQYPAEIIELLLNHGATPIEDTLSYALSYKHPIETIQLLLNHGATPDENSIRVAFKDNIPTEVIDLLLMHGAAELMADTHPRKPEMINRHQELIIARNAQRNLEEISDIAATLTDIDLNNNEVKPSSPEKKSEDKKTTFNVNGNRDIISNIASYVGTGPDSLTPNQRLQAAVTAVDKVNVAPSSAPKADFLVGILNTTPNRGHCSSLQAPNNPSGRSH